MRTPHLVPFVHVVDVVDVVPYMTLTTATTEQEMPLKTRIVSLI